MNITYLVNQFKSGNLEEKHCRDARENSQIAGDYIWASFDVFSNKVAPSLKTLL